MPLVSGQKFTPPFGQFNGHLQTVMPSFFREVSGVSYKRERIDTPDNDFIDLDASTENQDREKAILVSHGLEGHSSRHYVKGAVKIFTENHWDAFAWNYRSCSGEPNRKARFYHHADTPDLAVVINHLLKKYTSVKSLVLVGFSLGGNLICRYLGEQADCCTPKIKAAVAVSVPCDLQRCARELEKPLKHFYNKRFFKKLKKKVEAKSQIMPEAISMEAMTKYNIKSCRLFDEHYTAPLHGFKSADDFYTKAGCLPFLSHIRTPTLMLNAKNDPFLAGRCYPEAVARKSDFLFLEMPPQGGHTGFEIKNQPHTYAEKAALHFAEKHI